MPSYLDFNSSSAFRNFILGRTLQVPNGPQTFSESSYRVNSLTDSANVDLPDVDFTRDSDLQLIRGKNIFKPEEYPIVEYIQTHQITSSLQLYPYFVPDRHSLISVMINDNYDTESELFKFAAHHIRTDPHGPVHSRIARNLEAATFGKVRLLDALNGSISTAVNIVRGRESLVEWNYSITVAKTLPGKAIDFMQTVAGIEFPWSEIPGDYLSNPRNPIVTRPEARTEVGKIFQDSTGAIGSLFGIQRRPMLTRKPSDLMIEYMGRGQKSVLFDLLSYSTYAPDYTTTARSQNSSKVFNFIDNVSEAAKDLLGLEAPRGVAYIGDDRGDDVKYAMGDFYDRPVRSPFYLSLMFDPVQARLFQRQRNIAEGGPIGSSLTWISRYSKNKLGENNSEWSEEQSYHGESLSTNFGFRPGSILGVTQEILDTLPTEGGEARSHVANVIDQTSRVFREGDVFLSRGSAIKYVDKIGAEAGVEYCRVWTKDRSYMHYSDTMKRTGNIRKFDDSVMTAPWNLNMAPMSNGNKSFEGSTNIFKKGDGFYAKKYMFSFENLAWKTSNRKGYSYNDLPYCERGPNGGRVMWFPPYDLKITEQNSARWESNSFLGRPEPIYTYQNTERSGSISFKVVVDHPSILNLLVKEHFQGMSDEDTENYIQAFFAGCQDVDFYNLIRTYTTLTSDDIAQIKAYLDGGGDPEVIKKFRVESEDIVLPEPETSPEPETHTGIKLDVSLNFPNDFPKKDSSALISSLSYSQIYSQWMGNPAYTSEAINQLQNALDDILTGPNKDSASARKDKEVLFGVSGGDIPVSEAAEKKQQQVDSLLKVVDRSMSAYDEYLEKIEQLRKDIEDDIVQEITITTFSSTSALADDNYNFRLSVRRSNSILKEILFRLSGGKQISDQWDNIDNILGSPTQTTQVSKKFTFKDLGFEDKEGILFFQAVNAGEKAGGEQSGDFYCSDQSFIDRRLSINTAAAYKCRQSTVQFNYVKATKQQEEQKPQPETETNVPPRTRIVEDGEIQVPSEHQKPPVDVMKRIIMKTLSECYYFKVLEENHPTVFKSMREKLRYFHPGFHSMTPEGLNARLTFLHQCIRPGDTIPIKGISDELDLTARNTTFGPPPICVMRIGDFYNSKIVIRDVNMTFDDTTWDLNPEGIGVQPMLVNVQLQVSFIGGQGLKEPVNKLQNALSSNFYANTEMYDERSITTNETMGGVKTEEFTKKFLEELQNTHVSKADSDMGDDGNVITSGVFIGSLNNEELTYSGLVDDVYWTTEQYMESYVQFYNQINSEYGSVIGSLLISPSYRTINEYDVYNGLGSTGAPIQIFGQYRKGRDLSGLTNNLKIRVNNTLDSQNLSEIFGFNRYLTPPKMNKANELLLPVVKRIVEEKINSINGNDSVRSFELTRNELIKSLDSVNFLVKYGYDGKVDGEKATKATLSGFTSNLLYDEYSNCINHIRDNTQRMYADVDNTIDFNNPIITTVEITKILSTLLHNEKQEIMSVLESDTTIFDDGLRDKLSRRFDSFLVWPVDKKFRFKKLKNRRKDTDILFPISETTDITDSVVVEELKKLFSTNVPPTGNKLNYYR